MTAIINSDHLTNHEVGNFLRKSQCGIKRGSHKVCCEVSQIDYGEATTGSAPRIPDDPVDSSPRLEPSCGTMNSLQETPLKWIGELWFESKSPGRLVLEQNCLGVLISHKHFVIPADCVNKLSDAYTL